MNLGLELLRGIYGFGFEVPSPIQQKAFIPIIKGIRSNKKIFYSEKFKFL